MAIGINAYKRLLVLNFGLLVLSLGLIWMLTWRYFNIRTDAQSVWSTIADYQTARHNLEKWTPVEDVTYLEIYAQTSSRLENPSLRLIMEHEKKAIISDIIADLRKKTGKDLGNDPMSWIKTFAR